MVLYCIYFMHISLLLSRARPCLIVDFPLFSPFFAPSVLLLPFLPYHSTILVVVLFDSCLLGLFGPAACYSLNNSVWSLDLYSCHFGLSWSITLLVSSFVSFLTAYFSQGLGLVWLWAFLSSAYSFAPSIVLLPFLSCTLLFLLWCYLTPACWAPFRLAAYSSLNWL